MGRVAEGKNADLVLLDDNPVVSVQNLHKIFAVVRGGHYFSRQELDTMTDKVAKAHAPEQALLK
jgi:imidazolonepropionase-like amidohydrolase